MKAYAIDAYKGPLTLHDVAEPVAGAGDVVVEIAAVSVNPLDVKLRSGAFKAILPYDMPLVLGHDLAGVITAVGAGVASWKVGDAVFACAGGDRIGSFAERIAISQADIARKPASLDMDHAAALPLVALTAWQALVERANLQPGQRVLIHAGSGGVGTVAIQLAKHLGAYVATTVGPDNLELAKELGADLVIDYRNQAFEDVVHDYDVVLHTLDDGVLERSVAVLKPGGKLISISGPPDPAYASQSGANWIVRLAMRVLSAKIRRKARKRGLDYSFLFMRPDATQLEMIAAMVDQEILRPVIDTILPFGETPAALDRSAAGRARGKIVIRGAHSSAAA
ncbi:NADP-dependent oxidoreductase [Blastomonas fulva]|uniref:NADP-dependent oxidoreductase n=1 Tax=Blastomonas fulva TaxID=1550728 RepID=UPI0025A3911F|nr:NADP-dependent oxidoreductase [Blastomonas fulva]MDM7929841.1 NADP-dependent oxidoreductase [Blastomonas fulva]MDM7966802.1 NADP-dependent oxidoreductase [Blastomonas fulva]